MDTAKLIKSGNYQAIRLPKTYQLPGKKVFLKRMGRGILVLPEDTGRQPLIESLSKFDGDFMADRNQPPQQHRPEFFG